MAPVFRFIVKTKGQFGPRHVCAKIPSIRFGTEERIMKRQAISGLVIMLFAPGAGLGCGPFFPNTLLDKGDRVVLYAPEARFQSEIERIKLVAPVYHAQPASDAALQSMEADLGDLRAALEQTKLPPESRHIILQAYQQEKGKIDIS